MMARVLIDSNVLLDVIKSDPGVVAVVGPGTGRTPGQGAADS
jgi:hypothetical protein